MNLIECDIKWTMFVPDDERARAGFEGCFREFFFSLHSLPPHTLATSRGWNMLGFAVNTLLGIFSHKIFPPTSSLLP
jgi:hypothetical protein